MPPSCKSFSTGPPSKTLWPILADAQACCCQAGAAPQPRTTTASGLRAAASAPRPQHSTHRAARRGCAGAGVSPPASYPHVVCAGLCMRTSRWQPGWRLCRRQSGSRGIPPIAASGRNSTRRLACRRALESPTPSTQESKNFLDTANILRLSRPHQ